MKIVKAGESHLQNMEYITRTLILIMDLDLPGLLSSKSNREEH